MSAGAGSPRLKGTSRSPGAGVCVGAKREQTEVPKRATTAQGALSARGKPGGRGHLGPAVEAGVGDAPWRCWREGGRANSGFSPRELGCP